MITPVYINLLIGRSINSLKPEYHQGMAGINWNDYRVYDVVFDYMKDITETVLVKCRIMVANKTEDETINHDLVREVVYSCYKANTVKNIVIN